MAPTSYLLARDHGKISEPCRVQVSSLGFLLGFSELMQVKGWHWAGIEHAPWAITVVLGVKP